MPSPFPGMDPYLEDPARWPDVHHELISETRAYLNQRLRPKYFVRVEERVYVSDENDPGRRAIIPDLRVTEVPGNGGIARASEAGGAALDVAEPIIATTLIEDEIHEAYLEVINTEQRHVVTVIEVTSPTNKIAGSEGRKSFLQKRQEVMNSPSHWVEVDLLREGTPIVTREILPACEYLVHVSRVEKRPEGMMWPIRLRQRLPVISVPLRPEDHETKLDLQAVFDSGYDRAAYDLEMDYRKEPRVPWPAEYVEWADCLLREKGLRS
jgi:hypothetical protein